MSRTRALSHVLLPLVSAALFATACGDSTGPSREEGGTRAPPGSEAPGGAGTRDAAAPAEAASGSEVNRVIAADVGTGSRISAAIASTIAYTKAYCEGGSGSRVVRVPTQGGVQFKYTGSNATQRVWFRATFWAYPAGKAPTYLGPSEWFYTDLLPGQQSTAVWYRPTTGQWNSWNTRKSVAGGNTTTYVANMEYLWYQNGVQVGQQVTRATHVAASSGAIGGSACLWYEWVWIPLS